MTTRNSSNIGTRGLKALSHGWVRAFLMMIFIYPLTAFISGFVLVLFGFTSTESLTYGLPDLTSNEELMKATVLILLHLITLTLAIYSLRKTYENESFLSIGFLNIKVKSQILSGISTAAGTMLLGVFVLFLLDAVTLTLEQLSTLTLTQYFVFFSFAALTEELLFRGYILANLSRSMNKYIALIISSALFAAVHFGNRDISFLATLNIFLIGLLFGWYYMQTKSLWFPVAMHIVWNFMQGPILGFNVSGLPTLHILTISPTGPAWLTGGQFGFEGSVVCTVLILLTTILIVKQLKTMTPPQVEI